MKEMESVGFIPILILPWGILKCRKHQSGSWIKINLSFTTKINSPGSQVLLGWESCKLFTRFSNPGTTSSLCIPFLSCSVILQTAYIQWLHRTSDWIYWLHVSNDYTEQSQTLPFPKGREFYQVFQDWFWWERWIKNPMEFLICSVSNKDKKGPPAAKSIPACKPLGNGCVPVYEAIYSIYNYKEVLNLLLKGTFSLREKLAQTELFAGSALAKKHHWGLPIFMWSSCFIQRAGKHSQKALDQHTEQGRYSTHFS